jgi:uncharacterized membrane protein (UPF0127 family)
MRFRAHASSSYKFYAAAAAALLAPIAFQFPAVLADSKMPTAKIGDNLIKLEVAASQQEITRGLMLRESMPEDQGMVFLFHPQQKVNFWMYHTLIPLDMLFIKNGKIQKIFHDVPPCKSEREADCPTYPGGEGMEVSEVVELNAGYAKRHNVKDGDKIQLDLH